MSPISGIVLIMKNTPASRVGKILGLDYKGIGARPDYRYLRI